jgi:uncharacterized protein (DUF362 family)
MSEVAVTRADYQNVGTKIAESVTRAGGLKLNDRDFVVIKINLCSFRMPDTGAVTHPIFLDAFLSYLRREHEGLRIAVVDSDASEARPDRLIEWLGIKPVIARHQAEWVNLSKCEGTEISLNGRYFKTMKIPRIIQDCDLLVDMAKLKTHILTGISGTLKNQFGCLPAPQKTKFHHALDDVIVDCCMAMRPGFCMVDGILAMGGAKGPLVGTPVKSGVIITGKDPVAIDCVCARVMGFNPGSIAHIRKAAESGLGKMEYEIVGDSLPESSEFEVNVHYANLLRIVSNMRKRASW